MVTGFLPPDARGKCQSCISMPFWLFPDVFMLFSLAVASCACSLSLCSKSSKLSLNFLTCSLFRALTTRASAFFRASSSDLEKDTRGLALVADWDCDSRDLAGGLCRLPKLTRTPSEGSSSSAMMQQKLVADSCCSMLAKFVLTSTSASFVVGRPRIFLFSPEDAHNPVAMLKSSATRAIMIALQRALAPLFKSYSITVPAGQSIAC